MMDPAAPIAEAQNSKRTSGTFHMSDGILSKPANKKLRTGVQTRQSRWNIHS